MERRIIACIGGSAIKARTSSRAIPLVEQHRTKCKPRASVLWSERQCGLKFAQRVGKRACAYLGDAEIVVRDGILRVVSQEFGKIVARGTEVAALQCDQAADKARAPSRAQARQSDWLPHAHRPNRHGSRQRRSNSPWRQESRDRVRSLARTNAPHPRTQRSAPALFLNRMPRSSPVVRAAQAPRCA